MESITSILLKFFDEHNKVVYLMQQAITKEIQLTCKKSIEIIQSIIEIILTKKFLQHN